MKVTSTQFAERKYLFDQRDNNHFDLLIDGEQFFPRMIQSIHAAEYYILHEQYLFKSGRVATQFIDAFIVARKRGVCVHLLLDDFGSRALNHYDKDRLINNGVDLHFYNPASLKHFHRGLPRNHRKLLLVDNKVAFVGGAGISDEFDAANSKPKAWHEVMLEIHGPVVSDWQKLFLFTWQKSEKQILSLPVVDFAKADETKIAGQDKGRVVCARGMGKQEITRAFIQKIRQTRHRVWLTTPYFAIPWTVRRSLRYAAKKGVDVRVLVPGPYSDHPWVGHVGRRIYARLLRAGIRIYEYQPRFTHSKIQLCDDWVSIGSSNLDRWNLRWNLDANQVVDSTNIAEQIKSLFEKNFQDSVEINLERWMKRSKLQRVREWVSHQIVRLLERITKQ